MSLPPPDPTHTPTAIPPSSAPSKYASLHIDEPQTTASGTKRGEALYNSPPAGSQPTLLSRSQRTRTPTERGRLFKDDMQRSQERSTKIQQAKAHKSGSQDKGRGTGKGKRKTPMPASNSCVGANNSESEESDAATSGEWVVDSSDEAVPTSDPGELEQDGDTYASELDRHSFHQELTDRVDNLLQGNFKSSSRQTLKEILKLVRGDQTASLGASQQHSQVLLLPAQEMNGGGGHHLNYKPQPPAQKRRFVAPHPGPLKRGRSNPSPTPSTVLDEQSPPPIPKPLFPIQLDPLRPACLPESKAGPGAVGPPPRLPVSCAIPIPARSWSQPHPSQGLPHAVRDSSPDPLPAGFQLEDTQTQPEDTQTQPEDTQTQPEDTQTQPEPTQTQPGITIPAGFGSHATTSSLPRPPSQPQPAPANSSRLDREQPSRTTSVSVQLIGANASTRMQQLAGLSKKFDDNARRRAQAQAVAKKRRLDPLGSPFDYDEPMEDDTEEIAVARNLAAAQPVKRKKSKSGLNCQPGRPRQIATSAINDVTAYTFAKGPYETRLTNFIWGLEAYERCWQEELPDHILEPALPTLIKEIINRVPGHRTNVKFNIRTVIQRQYPFILLPNDQKDIDKNVALFESIKDDFHKASLETATHYEHPALKESFVQGLFDASHSPCVIFHEYFNLVPVETIAFVLTMMETCIREWRTGQEVTENLNSKEQAVMYNKHLQNLGRFAKGAPVRLNRMRREWYEAAKLKAVRDPEPTANSQATIRVEDIRGDTPPPAPANAGGSGLGNGA